LQKKSIHTNKKKNKKQNLYFAINMAETPNKKQKSEKLCFDEYPFLKELDLEEENNGVFNGEWFGNGPIYTTLNPSTGQAIARIRGVRTKEEKAFRTKQNFTHFSTFFFL
jgi:hypothetical protein